MGFHQSSQTQFFADTQITFDGFGIQNGTDQQDSVCTHQLCLINLVFVYRKILADHRGADGLTDIGENFVAAEKPLGFGPENKKVLSGRK